MVRLTQDARALPQLLTDIAEETAKDVAFIWRQRALKDAGFVQALGLDWLPQPVVTLHQLSHLP